MSATKLGKFLQQRHAAPDMILHSICIGFETGLHLTRYQPQPAQPLRLVGWHCTQIMQILLGVIRVSWIGFSGSCRHGLTMIWHWYRGGQSYPETYIYSQCVEPTKLHYTTLWWPQYIWQSCISLPLAFDLICFLLCSILQFAVRCKSHVNTTHHKLSTIASRFLSTCMTLIPMKRITQIAPLQVFNYI